MSVLNPLTHVLAFILATVHAGLVTLGLPSESGLIWVFCIAAVVAVVRLAMLPLVAHGVRHARAAGRAQPQLAQLARRYRGRTDLASRRSLLDDRRKIAAEHGLSRFAWLPLLLQVPIWLALYRLVSHVAGGHTVGAVSAGLAASLGGATLLGVHLASRGYFGAGLPHLVVVAGLACTAALLSYVTQKYLVLPNTVITDMPEAMTQARRLMPAVSAVSLVFAASVVPVALLVYWVCNGLWTLGQSAVVWRWFPTPGSPAAARAPQR